MDGGWWESDFLLLEWEVKRKQGEETRIIHGNGLELDKLV